MIKTCHNPDCRKKFATGHYGRKQIVCGKKPCASWYKTHWSETRKPPRGIPQEVYDRILRAVSDPLMRSLIIAARDSGMRKGELLGLSWDDVTGAGGKIKRVVEVRGQWQDGRGFTSPKTKRSRIAYFSDKTARALEEIRPSRFSNGKKAQEDNARIWPMSESRAWKFFVAVQRALKIVNPETGDPYRFHDLRHSVGVELVKAGRIDLAQKMLGHRKIETTMHYAERPPEEIADEVERVRKEKR